MRGMKGEQKRPFPAPAFFMAFMFLLSHLPLKSR